MKIHPEKELSMTPTAYRINRSACHAFNLEDYVGVSKIYDKASEYLARCNYREHSASDSMKAQRVAEAKSAELVYDFCYVLWCRLSMLPKFIVPVPIVRHMAYVSNEVFRKYYEVNRACPWAVKIVKDEKTGAWIAFDDMDAYKEWERINGNS